MRSRQKEQVQKVILALSDMFIVYAGIMAVRWLRHDIFLSGFFPGTSWIAVWIAASLLITFYMFDLYTDWQRKSLNDLIATIGVALTVFFLLIVANPFLYQEFKIFDSSLISMFLVQGVLLSTSRMSLWYISRRLYGEKKVLIVGKNEEEALTIAYKFLNRNCKGWLIVHGFLAVDEKRLLPDYLDEVDVILVSPSISHQQKSEIISTCSARGKEILVVPEFFEVFISDAVFQQVDDLLVLSIKPPSLSKSQEVLKRAADIAGAAILLTLTSPIVLLLFILIPMSSPGPALFKQERLGRFGAPYQIYKFRSMVNDAEKLTGPVLAADRDPRITKIGEFIRATRLDELPQLFNVLKGDMSLIGPRPEREYFVSQFKDRVPNYHYRMNVKPGITGLAQVLSKYTTSVEDKLRFDLMYIRNYSLWLDIKLILQTIRVVLQREQAEGVKEEHHLQELRLKRRVVQEKLMNH